MKIDYHFGENIDADTIINNDLIVLNISRKQVEESDLSFIERHVVLLQQCGVNAKQKVILLFEGYDNISAEIYEISALRSWMAKVIGKFPFLFYYISSFDNNSGMIAACIADVTKVSFGPQLTIGEYAKLGYFPPNLPKVHLAIKIPIELRNIIITATIEHGKSIGEKQNSITSLLNSIPGL